MCSSIRQAPPQNRASSPILERRVGGRPGRECDQPLHYEAGVDSSFLVTFYHRFYASYSITAGWTDRGLLGNCTNVPGGLRGFVAPCPALLIAQKGPHTQKTLFMKVYLILTNNFKTSHCIYSSLISNITMLYPRLISKLDSFRSLSPASSSFHEFDIYQLKGDEYKSLLYGRKKQITTYDA